MGRTLSAFENVIAEESIETIMQKLPNEKLNAFLRDIMVLVHNGLRRCSMLIADTDTGTHNSSMIEVVVVWGRMMLFCCWLFFEFYQKTYLGLKKGLL